MTTRTFILLHFIQDIMEHCKGLWNTVQGKSYIYMYHTHSKNTSGMFLSSSYICTHRKYETKLHIPHTQLVSAILNITAKIQLNQNQPSVAVIDLELGSGPLHKQLQYVFDRIVGQEVNHVAKSNFWQGVPYCSIIPTFTLRLQKHVRVFSSSRAHYGYRDTCPQDTNITSDFIFM